MKTIGQSSCAFLLALSASLCQAQANTTTRIEENDPSIAYSAAASLDPVGTHSSGRAVTLDQSGTRATVTFTGTGISWIGDTGFNRGVARVYLDGNVNTVDTFSDTRLEQQPLFVAKGLTNGVHTLVIEVTAMKNTNASGSGISIDAFDIQNGAALTGGAIANPGYFEQNSPSVTYTGSWYSNSSSRASAGSAVMAMDPGAKVNVEFNGTGILWIGYRDPWSGYARVLVDGVQKGLIDTYDWAWGNLAVDEQWQRPIWQISDLAPGTHTLTIEVLAQKSGASAGTWIWVDAFRVTGPSSPTP